MNAFALLFITLATLALAQSSRVVSGDNEPGKSDNGNKVPNRRQLVEALHQLTNLPYQQNMQILQKLQNQQQQAPSRRSMSHPSQMHQHDMGLQQQQPSRRSMSHPSQMHEHDMGLQQQQLSRRSMSHPSQMHEHDMGLQQQLTRRAQSQSLHNLHGMQAEAQDMQQLLQQ